MKKGIKRFVWSLIFIFILSIISINVFAEETESEYPIKATLGEIPLTIQSRTSKSAIIYIPKNYFDYSHTIILEQKDGTPLTSDICRIQKNLTEYHCATLNENGTVTFYIDTFDKVDKEDSYSTIRIKNTSTDTFIRYYFDFCNQVPTLAENISAVDNAEIAYGNTYTLDLSTIFVDPDKEDMTYQISVNGAEAVAADKDYQFTPTQLGEYTLVFTVSDSEATSAETYTVHLTVKDIPVELGELKKLKVSSHANYVGNHYYLSTGIQQVNSSKNAPVYYYITRKESGTLADAIEGYTMTTDVVHATTISQISGSDSSKNGMDITNLPVGKYYVAAQLGEDADENVQRIYSSLTVYEDANAYLKALIDNTIDYYQTEGFVVNGKHLGLSASTGADTGIDWELYQFMALGYDVNDPLLCSEDGVTPLARFESFSQTYEQLVSNALAPKFISRYLIAAASAGMDVRTEVKDSEGNVINLVQADLSLCYKDGDIASGELSLDEDGCLDLGKSDTIGYCYLGMALEVANATPEEGYTEELRAAIVKKIYSAYGKIDYTKLDSEIGSDDFETGSQTVMSDYYSMSMYCLTFMNDVKGCEGMAKKMLDNYVKNFKVVVKNGNKGNAFTNAVAVSALSCAGVSYEEIATSDEWKDGKTGQSLISMLGQWQLENGGFGSNEGMVTRMLVYETFGALVDMYTGQSCFVSAHDNYMKANPQYSEEVAYATEVLNSLDVNSAETVAAARKVYDALTDGQKNFIDDALVKALLQAETTLKIVNTTPFVSSVKAAAYNKIAVTWNTVSDADGYYVYRKSPDGVYKLIVTIKSGKTTSYTDTVDSGITYTYMVKSYRTQNTKAYSSKESNAKSAKAIPATPVISKVASAGYNKIKLTWGKVAGANKYVIYRSTSKNGTYSFWTMVTGTSYTDSYKINTGQTYYYKVRVYRVNSTGLLALSNESGVKSGKAALSAATLKSVTAGKKNSKKLTVKWSKVSGASGYVIYTATKKNGKYTKKVTITKGSTTSYALTKLKKGTKYFVKIRAYRTVNGKKVYGSYSGIKSAKVK